MKRAGVSVFCALVAFSLASMAIRPPAGAGAEHEQYRQQRSRAASRAATANSVGTPGAIHGRQSVRRLSAPGYGRGRRGHADYHAHDRGRLNTYSGAITLLAAAGSATPASFTVTNSKVAATDTIVLSREILHDQSL
jgi:hypothetical protein